MRSFLQVLMVSATMLLGTPALSAPSAQGFVDAAAAGGMFEVQSSQLALKMAKADDVKSFAQMMVKDHEKANSALQALAKSEGLKVPGGLDSEHAAKIKTLQNAGAQFDPPYVKAQLEGHQKTVKLFEDYASMGDNAALRDFAKQTLPVLKTHLEKIEKISGQLGTE